MGLDILGAFRRMVHLPAAHNSLSDLLGKDVAHVVAQTIHAVLADTVTVTLHTALVAGETGTNIVAALLTEAVHGTLHGLSPALSQAIEDRIASAVHDGEALAEGTIPKIATTIVADISAILKLSEK